MSLRLFVNMEMPAVNTIRWYNGNTSCQSALPQFHFPIPNQTLTRMNLLNCKKVILNIAQMMGGF